MIDIILIITIAALVGGALVYIVKAKKKGVKCIGCPAAECCQAGNHEIRKTSSACCSCGRDTAGQGISASCCCGCSKAEQSTVKLGNE